ncbi:hypothetical protein WICPIJ_001699 [Wickerhamomyces pijperi]|uniref:Monopolin complex subunit Csm1/Pcs1 C-terminal domain-containing protein n=1 Tax=Wickerhamomyces pijperi TaxID=599730 RepID=A0A9P8TQC2_WICPI|nr:hypothetical protein WICPIJ_001699 [Wickerhamomyces pijperi]
MPPKIKTVRQAALRSSSRARTPTTKAREHSEGLAEEQTPKRARSTPAESKRTSRARTPAKTIAKDLKVPKKTSTGKKPVDSTVVKQTKAASKKDQTSEKTVRKTDFVDFFNSSSLAADIERAFLAKDVPKLDKIIDELKLTHSEKLFKELQAKTENLQTKSDEAIRSLTTDIEDLKAENLALKEKLASLSSTPDIPSRPITAASFDGSTPTQGTPQQTRNNRANSITTASETDDYIEMNIDMTEQITGHRIIQSTETKDEIIFRCLQTGSAGEWRYTLIVDKDGDSDDMLYIPGFQHGESNVEEERLRSVLPEYFFEQMKFPMGSLKEMYSKLNKYINKASS